MSPKERLHTLVDELPEADMPTAERFLAWLRDTGGKTYRDGVEEVDEPLTPEEIAEAEAGWRECQEGKAIPWEEARKRLAGG